MIWLGTHGPPIRTPVVFLGRYDLVAKVRQGFAISLRRILTGIRLIQSTVLNSYMLFSLSEIAATREGTRHLVLLSCVYIVASTRNSGWPPVIRSCLI